MKRNIWKNLELKTIIIMLVVIALLSSALYFVFYAQYYGLLISKLKEDASLVNKHVQEVISEESFTQLKTREDEQTQLYIETHIALDNIRRFANILYLYTAKADESGKLIYVVDGLNEEDIGDGYFCHIGDPIEPELTDLLSRCLAGEEILGNDILVTDWGIVYAAYFPFLGSDGGVVGAIGMEFDCENIYNAAIRVRYISVFVALAISLIFVIIAYIVVNRIVKNAEKAFVDVEKEKSQAEAVMKSIMNASPMCCQYWSRELKVIDCNQASLNLFGYNDTQSYTEKWLFECNPEYQPDGQRSEIKGPAMLEKAFDEGSCTFFWEHTLPDGSTLPTEVTFVRVDSGSDSFIAAYTKDLRKEKELEERAGDLYSDELTGAYTKQYMDGKLERIIRMLSRADSDLSVMMVGIDFQKQYLEAYGEKKNRNCIRTVAGILSAAARRADDFVVRYRDGDFLVILPNTDKKGAELIAETIKNKVHACNIPHKKSAVASYVTVSIGIVSSRVVYRQRVSDYLNRAEEMLYIAKQSGRDRHTHAKL